MKTPVAPESTSVWIPYFHWFPVLSTSTRRKREARLSSVAPISGTSGRRRFHHGLLGCLAQVASAPVGTSVEMSDTSSTASVW